MSNDIREIFTGGAIAVPVQLYTPGGTQTFNIPTDATVCALIRDSAGVETLGIDQSSSAEGADWSESLVIVEMDQVEVDKLTVDARATLQIKILEVGSLVPKWINIKNVVIREGLC